MAEKWLMAGIKSDPWYNTFFCLLMGWLVLQFSPCFGFISCLYVSSITAFLNFNPGRTLEIIFRSHGTPA